MSFDAIASELVEILDQGIMLASVSVCAVVAVFSALRTARKHVEAKRQVIDFALANSKVLRELSKATLDSKIAETEAKLIIRVIEREMSATLRVRPSAFNDEARAFVRELDPYRNRRVVEELAREALRLSV